MIVIPNLKLAPGADEAALKALAAKALKIPAGDIAGLRIRKKSLDARKKDDIHYVYTVGVTVRGDEQRLVRRCRGAAITREKTYPIPHVAPPETRPVIVGFGPAGMFAALVLSMAGLCPLVLEEISMESLRGEEGTSVKLTVRRYGRDITVTCERRQVNRVYVSNKTMADGVEYIKVSAIGSQNDWSAFSEIWDSLPSKNTRAVILDLRGNGGGLIDAALKMANVMTPVKDAELAGVRYRDDMGGLEQTYSTGNALPLNKIVVLVDGGTASAAELLAGSLQDTGSATLIGSKTYGKGQGQFHIDLVNGDKLVITTLELELPKQGCWEGVGLTPDIQLENRKVTVNTKNLKSLDTSTTLRFGDSSDAVYAMTERLSLLGLLTEATGRYDGDVADAVASFRAAYDLPAALYASPEMLSALDEAVTALNGQTYLVDDQLQSALEMCRLAAAKPQQYTVKSDGSWTKK